MNLEDNRCRDLSATRPSVDVHEKRPWYARSPSSAVTRVAEHGKAERAEHREVMLENGHVESRSRREHARASRGEGRRCG
jgi:hypothetical protein